MTRRWHRRGPPEFRPGTGARRSGADEGFLDRLPHVAVTRHHPGQRRGEGGGGVRSVVPLVGSPRAGRRADASRPVRGDVARGNDARP